MHTAPNALLLSSLAHLHAVASSDPATEYGVALRGTAPFHRVAVVREVRRAHPDALRLAGDLVRHLRAARVAA